MAENEDKNQTALVRHSTKPVMRTCEGAERW